MGNWNINVQGVGAHHNKTNSTDADRMFDEFVAKLKAAGHSIQHATFTHGALETPESLENRRKWAAEDAVPVGTVGAEGTRVAGMVRTESGWKYPEGHPNAPRPM